MMRRFVLTLLAAALAACSPGTGGAAPTAAKVVHPESGLEVIPLTVTSASGVHEFKVEVAASMVAQAKGLMFRTKLGPDEGMIFPMDPPRGASFWMRNTVISLDLIFVAPDGRISNIAANAVPYDETPLLSVGKVKGVLEIPGGRAAELGIAPGDKVAW
ncbi:MAG: hypothetical protein RL671_2181 [Pseudomonadota bacterium]|jgi:uncharacterized membrane protein (UPF0127 family)